MRIRAMMCFVIVLALMTVGTAAALSPPIVYVSANNDGDYNCDGTSDETQINQALAYVRDNAGFTTVYLKNDGGTNDYIIDGTIEVPTGTTFTGDTGVTVKLIDDYRPPRKDWQMVSGNTAVVGHDYKLANNIIISQITFDADRWNQGKMRDLNMFPTIELRGVNLTFHDLSFTTGVGDFIKVVNYGETEPDLEIYDNYFGRCGHSGVYVLRTGSTGENRIWIHDNEFGYVAANAGIRLDECSGALIENNVFTTDNEGDSAIYLIYDNDPSNIGLSDNEIRYNTVYDVREYGIVLMASVDGGIVDKPETTGNYIHHNLIYNSHGDDGRAGGICIHGIDDVTIESNTIVNCDGDGISTRQYSTINPTYTTGFTITAKNNIITGMNAYESLGYGINNVESSKHTIISDYNCIYDNELGNYNNVDIGDYDIFSDPKFYDAANGLYYLNSTAVGGTYNGTGWVTMGTMSPCIDAGDPADPYSNEPENNGDRANLGRYGNTEYASKSRASLEINVHSADSIQDAVDTATNGDTIIVYPGVYTENVDVYKKLAIISESGNPDDTIVQAASSNDHVFHVTADNVTINGFTATGVTGDDKSGIYLYGVEGCTITNNTASNNDLGIYLYDSSNNLIYNNYFNNTNNTLINDSNGNVWNITKTAGTNIIGGDSLGGNYWSDYSGVDTDGDGLGDTLLPYNSAGGIPSGGDYLPLVLEVPNSAPTADANGPYLVTEGSVITLDASVSSDPEGDALTYRWDFNNDSIWDTLWLTDPTLDHTWTDDYDGYIAVEVNDSEFTSIATASVTVNNVAPVVDAGSDQTVVEGSAVAFSGIFSDSGADDTHTFEWNFGDGTINTSSLAPTHVYASDGTYTVILTVTDDDLGFGTDTLTVTVTDAPNSAPTADANGPYLVTEGSVITLDASVSSDPEGDALTYRWDFNNDSIWDTLWLTDPTLDHTWTDDYDGYIAVEVNDSEFTSIATASVTVNNVAPVVDVGSDQTVVEGSAVAFSGIFSDSGADDTHTFEWNFGDGTINTSSLAPTHVYASDGTYTVILTVTDDDLGVGTDTLTVTVTDAPNSAPTADANGPYLVTEGSVITLDASVSSDPEGDALTYRWDFNNDSIWDTLWLTDPTLDHTWTDDYDGYIAVEVNDSEFTSIATASVTVNNVAPVVDAGSDQTVVEGSAVAFSGIFSDSGADDTHTFEWNFGDGTINTSSLAPTHVYASDGTYTVILTVTDDDLGVGTDTLTVTVTDAPNSAPTADANGPYLVTEGSVITLDASVSSDPEGDALTYRWDFNNDSIWDTLWLTDPTLDHTWTDDYDGYIAVEVNDSEFTSIATASVTVNNVAPVVDAGSGQTVVEGSAVAFSGIFSDSGADDTHTFEWNFGDGTINTSSLAPTHVYASDGTYTVILTVTDDDLGVGTDTLTVTVTDAPNSAPTADANGPYLVTEGSVITLDASVSSDPEGDALTYRWDFNNDSIWDTLWLTDPTLDHTWTDDYDGYIAVEVNDSEFTSIATASVTVNNVAPVVDAGSGQTVVEGSAVAFSGIFSDSGADDTHTFEWNFGDGTINTSSLAPTHVYASDGTYTVILTVTDDDLGVGTDTLTVTVTDAPNSAPTADANGPYLVTEGSVITLDASVSSDPEGDALTYRWDFNNDSIWDTLWLTDPTLDHTWTDDYDGYIAVEVNDSEFTSIATASVTVNNVAPEVTSLTELPEGPVEIGTLVNLSAEFLDLGIEDTHNYTIDWGDNTVDDIDIIIPSGNRAVATNHMYATSGLYNVTFTVEDDDGDSDTEFQYVLVYDSEGGYVVGKGSFNSPAGAYVADSGLTGVATFDFSSKYKKDVLTGETQFEFENLKFHSVDYEWMVVAGHKATYKGNGTVNGEGNYGFLMSVIDAELTSSADNDMFRIKIWDKDNNDAIVYDNMPDEDDDADSITAILKGRIQIRS
ncbi:PKD domain-containing protein [Methanococcoides orientis]|uniref:PKD domain-containing protein n=1 Tax=Methanococcoides orientis TaxID=2822137 RepID=UPI001E59042D|nr:PKD domain-containing protein [Methanococcoides orientis]UGV41789.1 PKD domain-containing protein [Methanococcoides orientis]